MYLDRLLLRDIKLIRSLELDFTRDGKPRMWTVLLGLGSTTKVPLANGNKSPRTLLSWLELGAGREVGLSRIRTKVAVGEPPVSADLKGYQIAQRALYQPQNGKCCYCENWNPRPTAPVEHYCPKLRSR